MNASKKRLGEDSLVICAMSGDFVQRGEPAMYSKYARAKAACLCGTDIVVELPLPWSLSSAEGFARGSVELLGAMGISHLSFGSECGNVEVLAQLADVLLDNNIYEEIKIIQRENASLSYAAARQKAVETQMGERAELLANPNNILGVEYIKAIKKLDLDIKPVTVQRIGNDHDCAGQVGPKSASEIRNILRAGGDIKGLVPDEAQEVYAEEARLGREQSRSDIMELTLMSRLRMLSREEFNSAPDAGDGLGDRIYSAVREASSMDELYEIAKTKRFALSRIRRTIMCAALGVKNGMSEEKVPYARVLAANPRGCAYLRSISEKTSIPVITKPAHVKALSSDCTDVFALGAKAHDLYVLSYGQKKDRKGSEDWRTGPFIVKNL